MTDARSHLESRSGSERGSALILVLLLAAVFALLGASLLSSSLNSARIAANEQSSAQAFSIAEAGIDRARIALGSTTVPALPVGGWVLLSNQPLDSGSYNVVVTNNVGGRFPLGSIPADPGGATTDTDGFLVVNSTGTLGLASRRIEVIIQKVFSPFRYAVWANTSQNFSGAGYTDSWNSAAGDYGSTHTNTGGSVFCNGDITMSASSTIYGNAEVGGSITAGHVQNGTTTTGAPAQTMTNPNCPGSYTPTANVCSGAGITYDAVNGDLTVSGNSTNCVMTAPPNTLSFRNVKLSGGGTLTVNSGGTHVDIYVARKLDVSGGTVVNPSAQPGMLNFSACGPATDDFKVSGGSEAYFTVYAPTRHVELSGGSPLYGAIVSDTFTDSGGSAVHYDTALNSSSVAMVPGSWAEIYQ